MQDAIKEILNEVPRGKVFDTHYVISRLIKRYSDAYLSFASGINADSDRTLVVHGNIGQIIAKHESVLVSQLPNKSWSENVHGESSSCSAWMKL